MMIALNFCLSMMILILSICASEMLSQSSSLWALFLFNDDNIWECLLQYCSLLSFFSSLDVVLAFFNDDVKSEIFVGYCCLAYDEHILRHSFMLFGYLDGLKGCWYRFIVWAWGKFIVRAGLLGFVLTGLLDTGFLVQVWSFNRFVVYAVFEFCLLVWGRTSF